MGDGEPSERQTIVAAAWSACAEAEPPYLFGLLFFDLPFTGVILWLTWAAGMLVTQRRPLWAVLLPLGTAAVVAWASIADRVPINEPGYYADLRSDLGASVSECGPTGIPKWWPTWLPI